MPWEPRPPLGTARGGLDTARTLDGVIYSVGGFGTKFEPIYDSVEKRDPVSEEWTFVKPMSIPRGNPGAVYLDGRIYVVGGATGPHNDSNKGEAYDPSVDTWTRIKNRLGGPILGIGAAAFDGRVYIIGGGERGHAPKAITNAVDIYHPTTDKWSKDAKPMPTARMLLRAVELGGQIYAVGGAVADGQPFSDALERYDPIADTWTKLRSMGVGRGNPGVAVAEDGRIVVVGGAGGTFTFNGATPRPTVEVYDPQADAWTPSEPLPVARASLGAERGRGNAVLAIGGFEAAGAGVPPPASKRAESRQF